MVTSLTFFLIVAIYSLHCTSLCVLTSVDRGSKECHRRLNFVTMKSLDPISQALRNPQWPAKWPFQAGDFRRTDETNDSSFYNSPRLVHHIDEGARRSLTEYYASIISPQSSVLDICSSWVSHYPENLKFSRSVGLGMNGNELKQNKQLSEFVVQDLNTNPLFPFSDNSFDYVTCVVSVDYLIRPLEVFSEIKRVLKPNGLAIISQSNRCFPTKAINIWLNTDDAEHAVIIGAYFHYSFGFSPAEAIDISPNKNYGDPMFIIQARKL